MSDDCLLELRGKMIATNRWVPNRLYIYDDRIEEVVPARSLVTAALGKNERHVLRYEQVAAVSLKTGVGWSALTIESTGGHTIVVKGVNKTEGARARQLVQDRLDTIRQAPKHASVNSPAVGGSTADELAKLASLRDSGAISEEEFAAAKRKAIGPE